MTFRTKDLVSLGVFTAVYLVIYYAINMIAAFGPFLQPVTEFVAILVCGIVFMLFLARVTSVGVVALMAVLLGVILTLLGHHPITVLTALVAGVAAELIIGVGRGHRSQGRDVVGYGVFSLWSVGGILPLLFLRDDMLTQVRDQMGPDYAASFEAVMSPGVVVAMAVSFFVAGIIGGLLGRRMLSRHFVRAGVA